MTVNLLVAKCFHERIVCQYAGRWHSPGAKGLQAAEEQSRLIHVTERRNRSLQSVVQLEPEVGGDEQVPRGLVLGGIKKTLVQVGGEEHGFGKLVLERLEDQGLVVEVASQDSDGLPAFRTCRLHLVDQALQVIDLGPSERLDVRRIHQRLSSRQYTVAHSPLARSRRVRCSISREPAVNSLLIGEEPQCAALKSLRKRVEHALAVKGVPLGDERDRRFVRRCLDSSELELMNKLEG